MHCLECCRHKICAVTNEMRYWRWLRQWTNT